MSSEKLQTIVYLVRHGETDHRYSVDQSIDEQRRLTDRGKEQSQKVGRYLAQFQPTKIYSSPLDRCKDTAEIIAQETGYAKDIELTNSLVEIYSDVPSVREEVGERGESIFKTILEHHRGEQVVAVTHKYIIGYIVAQFRGREFREVECKPADIYRLVFADAQLVEATHLQPAYA